MGFESPGFGMEFDSKIGAISGVMVITGLGLKFGNELADKIDSAGASPNIRPWVRPADWHETGYSNFRARPENGVWHGFCGVT